MEFSLSFLFLEILIDYGEKNGFEIANWKYREPPLSQPKADLHPILEQIIIHW